MLLLSSSLVGPSRTSKFQKLNYFRIAPEEVNREGFFGKIYDELHKHVYKQVLWFSFPISYAVLANTLFRDPATMLGLFGLDNEQVPRYTFLQTFLVGFFYKFYKSYYNRDSEDEYKDFLYTLGVVGVPVQSFAMYYWASQ